MGCQSSGVDTGVATGVLADGTIATTLSDRPAGSIGERTRARVAVDLGLIFSLDKDVAPMSREDRTDAVKRVDLRRNESRHISSWLPVIALVAAGILLYPLIGRSGAAPQQAVATPNGQSLTVAGGGAGLVLPSPVRPVVSEVSGAVGAVRTPRRDRPVAVAQSTTKRTKPPARDADSGTAVASLRACAGLEERLHAWCMRPAILRADDRLRTAYNHAVKAGVSRRLLLSYRLHWSRLRRKAASDPEAVINGYHRIGQELRVEAGQLR